MKTYRQSVVARMFPLLSMLVGTALMIALVILMNQRGRIEVDDSTVSGRDITFHKKPAPKQQLKPKPRPRPKKAPRQPKAPLPELASILSGIDLGIPEFDPGDIGTPAEDLLSGVKRDTIMSESTVDIKPRVMTRAAMEYPRAALKKSIKGYVLFNLLVNETGDVEVAKVLESNPPGVFDSVAMNGIRGWRFSPAQYQRKAVKVWVRQRIRFDFN